MKKILFNSKAFLGAITEKISDAACKTGKSIQEYMEDEENIRHISLVVYDLMPLSVKFGLRHEKFYQQFKLIFVGIRKQLFPQSKNQSVKSPTKIAQKTTKAPTARKTSAVRSTTNKAKSPNSVSGVKDNKKPARKTSKAKEV